LTRVDLEGRQHLWPLSRLLAARQRRCKGTDSRRRRSKIGEELIIAIRVLHERCHQRLLLLLLALLRATEQAAACILITSEEAVATLVLVGALTQSTKKASRVAGSGAAEKTLVLLLLVVVVLPEEAGALVLRLALGLTEESAARSGTGLRATKHGAASGWLITKETARLLIALVVSKKAPTILVLLILVVSEQPTAGVGRAGPEHGLLLVLVLILTKPAKDITTCWILGLSLGLVLVLGLILAKPTTTTE